MWKGIAEIRSIADRSNEIQILQQVVSRCSCASFMSLYHDGSIFLLLVLLVLLVVLLVFALEVFTDAVFELLPRVAVQAVAELAVVVHLGPAVAAPFTARHVDQEIPVPLLVVDIGIVALFSACAGREAHDLSLLDECNVWANPGLVLIHVLECILFFVLPFHVLLLVADRVPPNVEQPVGPYTPSNHKGSHVEATAILGDKHVDRIDLAVSDWRACFGIEVFVGQRVRDVQGIVLVDVAVGDLVKALEDVLLQGLGWFHDEGVGV
jgi:hypothetical protein